MKPLFILLFSFLITGCIGIDVKPEDIEQNLYTLDIQRIKPPFNKAIDTILLIRKLKISQHFRDKSFIYYIKPNVYERDFYNQFLTSPQDNITEEIKQWFSNNNLFTYTTTGSSVEFPSRYILEGDIIDLYGDYSNKKFPYAVISIELIVLKEDLLNIQVILKQKYSQRILISNKASNLVRGWNQGFEKIMYDFEEDLHQTLKNTPSNP